VSVVYNCCWPSPPQSFLGPSPAGPITTFYCLRFETPQTWRTTSPYLYPPGTWWPSYTPRHWVPFSSPPMTRRAMVEVFDPASTRASRNESQSSLLDFTIDSLCSLCTDRIENISHNSSSIVAVRGYHSDGVDNTILLLLFTAIT
jgi:hypothetical protein